MFKLLRKVIISLVALILGAILYHLLASAVLPAKQRHAIENAQLKAKEERFCIWTLTNYVRPLEFRIRQNFAVKPGYGTD
jgi:hypothetical protein